MVFYNNSAQLRELNKHHTSQHTHEYGQPHSSNIGRILLQQPRDSLPNASLQEEPPESLPNISVENNSSLALQYSSYNHHANQSSSHSQSHKVAFPNHMLGEVNQSGYQHQPNVSVGTNQYTSQVQAAKVVLPNHRIMLGEANQNLPSDSQHQGNFSLTRSGLTFSANQSASSSQNISLPAMEWNHNSVV